MPLKDYIPATITDAEGNEIENPEIEIHRVASENPGLDYIPEEPAEAPIAEDEVPSELKVSVKPIEEIVQALTPIKHIGDKSARKLADAGIDTLDKFAATAPAKIIEILGAGWGVEKAQDAIMSALELIDAAIEPEESDPADVEG